MRPVSLFQPPPAVTLEIASHIFDQLDVRRETDHQPVRSVEERFESWMVTTSVTRIEHDDNSMHGASRTTNFSWYTAFGTQSRKSIVPWATSQIRAAPSFGGVGARSIPILLGCCAACHSSGRAVSSHQLQPLWNAPSLISIDLISSSPCPSTQKNMQHLKYGGGRAKDGLGNGLIEISPSNVLGGARVDIPIQADRGILTFPDTPC